MTQEEFDRLPVILSSGQVGQVLGMEYHDVQKLAKSNPKLCMGDKVAKENGFKHLRFYKSEVARLARLKY